MTRKFLYELTRTYFGRSIDEKLTYMENELIQITKCPIDDQTILSRNLKYLKSEFKKKWTAASNKEKRLKKK